MKNIKEMIIPILVGFTLMTSIYSTIKISQLEREIYYLDSDFHDTGLNGEDERDELSDRIYDIENRLNMR